MKCSPTKLYRLALELRDLRNLRDAVALLTDDAVLASRAVDLRAAHAPELGALSSTELAALLGLELTPTQLEVLELLRSDARLSARTTGDGYVNRNVALRLLDAGLARRDGYWFAITRAGRLALEHAIAPRPPLAKVRHARVMEATA